MPVSPKAKAVLLAMQCFDGGDGLVWPSKRALMDATSLSRTAVYDGTRELIEAGAITLERKGGGAGRSTVYRLTGKPFGDPPEPPKRSATRTVRHTNGPSDGQNSACDGQNSACDAPEVPKKYQGSTKQQPARVRRETSAGILDVSQDEWDSVLNAWTKAGGGLQVSPRVVEILSEQVAAHGVDRVLAAIDDIACTARGRPDPRWIPDRIARLSQPRRRQRRGSRFDGYASSVAELEAEAADFAARYGLGDS